MALVPAKCTQCGANLEVDSSKEAAICPHCKTPFITEKAINHFHTTNITNIDTINAEVVNVESSESASNLARTAETFVNFGEWDKAREIYVKMTQMYSFDWRGWYGLLRTDTHNFQLQFDRYEDYNALVENYERLIAVSNDSVPDLTAVIEYLNSIYGKVEATVSNNYRREQQFIQEQMAKEKALIKDEVPLEIQEKKVLGSGVTKIIWIVWVAIATLVSLIQGISITTSLDDLDIEFEPFRFANMEYFWDIVLYMSISLLIIQVLISFVLFCIGSAGVVAQKHSKQKRLTAFKFITKGFIIAASAHLMFWLMSIFIVFIKSAEHISPHYRYIDTVLFHSKATATGACWIALLLIIIYSAINYALIAGPMFVTERIGDEKRRAILINIRHKQEVARLMKQEETLPKRHGDDLIKLKMLRAKHQ